MAVSFIGGENRSTRRKPLTLSEVTDKLFHITLYLPKFEENLTWNNFSILVKDYIIRNALPSIHVVLSIIVTDIDLLSQNSEPKLNIVVTFIEPFTYRQNVVRLSLLLKWSIWALRVVAAIVLNVSTSVHTSPGMRDKVMLSQGCNLSNYDS